MSPLLWVFYWGGLAAAIAALLSCAPKKKAPRDKSQILLPLAPPEGPQEKEKSKKSTKKKREKKSRNLSIASISDEERLLRIQNTTIARLILENEQEKLLKWNELIPKTIPDWVRLFDGGTGKVSGLLIPFSLAPQFSSLESPRVVLTAPEGSPERGRVFLAVLEDETKRLVEFISWNPVRGAFDFGEIEFRDGQQKVSFANEPTCFSCHRTRSPIFPEESWDNSVINRSVLAAFIEANPNDLPELNEKLAVVLERDRAARKKSPPAMDDFIDPQMQEDEVFAKATYKGFPFVDVHTEQSFDFNQAIFDAHSLVVATDWLQTLPNQGHAAQIANDKETDLTKLYPEHYRSLSTFKNPFLLNYNIVAGKVNAFHELDEVVPSEKHVAAVREYNETAKAKRKHEIPDRYRPTSDQAFEHNLVRWQDYLTVDILERVYREGDPRYQPKAMTRSEPGEVVSHDKLCSSCHDGAESSPRPNYSFFNPLIEVQWVSRLRKGSKKYRQLLCDTLSRINSPTSPMPPENSKESHSFVTYRNSVILSLQTLVERFEIESSCE